MSTFYTSPYNYGNPVTVSTIPVDTITDDDNNTFYEVNQNSVTINFSLGLIGRTIDSIYIVGENISTYNLSVGGTTVINARDLPVLKNGKDYDLFSFTERSATSANLSLVRSNNLLPMRIYNVYLMDHIFTFPFLETYDDFTGGKENRIRIVHEALDGTRTVDSGLQNRRKWTLTYTTEGLDQNDIETLIDFGDEYENFIHNQHFDLYPERVFRAYNEDDFNTRFRTLILDHGEVSTFTIKER